jgi:hypothetical protein
MEPRRADEMPTSEDQAQPCPVRKRYTSPKATQHGKLPALTPAGSLSATDNA